MQSKALRKTIAFAGSLEVTTVAMVYLFGLVLAATFYQLDHSIHETTRRFIYAWLFRVGPVPLPAGQLVFSVLGANLIVATVTRIPWRWSRAGLIVTHLGLVLLVIGGLTMRLFVEESILALTEGESDQYSYDLRAWDLVVEDGEERRFPLASLPDTVAGRELRVITLIEDSSAKREGPEAVESASGARSIADALVRRQNPVPGLVLEIDDRNVLLHGSDPTAFTVDDDLSLRLLPRRYELGAEIRLTEFESDFFEGTQTPRAFRSEVEVIENGAVRHATISMNEPLRLGDATFYQLGYDSSDVSSEVSVFQVVSNPMRWLPYAVGLSISLGLAIHAVIRGLERGPRRRA